MKQNDRIPMIEVAHVSKYFYLPHERITSFKESAARLFKPTDTKKLTALCDVSFSISRGECIGIIGHNGSGKSTLLKILAKIYYPNSGNIRVNGSISPFLELGVGFNPELTARENIYLNGIVLGISRKEITRVFPQIVAFSQLEKFMDTKLKNFSSGMQVRLAFSVAIQPNADIYLMDEVLAVGDIDFQKKCSDVIHHFKKTGKTVVIVSHDLKSIKAFCNRTLWVDDGIIKHSGVTTDIVKKYVEHSKRVSSHSQR